MNRAAACPLLACSALMLMTACLARAAGEERRSVTPVKFTVKLEAVHSGFDRKMCWVHARAGVIPGPRPAVVMTMQKLLLSGSDVFYALHEMRSDDLGRTWSEPRRHETLKRRRNDEIEIGICDFTPKWHAKTSKLLGTGQNVHYRNNRVMGYRHRQVAYSVYDEKARTWSRWRTMEMPDNVKFFNAGAGSTQRIDLPDGDILLPIYYKSDSKTERCYSATVARCRFDGRTLFYVEHGSELKLDVPRGFAEPSLARFGDRYFLTLRNDKAGWVTSGKDGLHFDKPVRWRFDDGKELGNYNTQQHWVTHPKGLLLVYTRRGAGNDHVFRHRAPLFIAQVDPARLRVIRRTERILVPQRGARLGNFGVVRVNDSETWVTVTEWMQPRGCEKHGADNSVYVARIIWE